MKAQNSPKFNDQTTKLKFGVIIPFVVLTVSRDTLTVKLNFTNGT